MRIEKQVPRYLSPHQHRGDFTTEGQGRGGRGRGEVQGAAATHTRATIRHGPATGMNNGRLGLTLLGLTLGAHLSSGLRALPRGLS